METTDPSSLRTKAEATLQKNKDRPDKELLYELQVHQIELEMQNESLQRSYAALETSRDQFAELYDFAPVGYLTLTSQGLVTEANLTVAEMLGVERGKLLRCRFSGFVSAKDSDQWHIFSVGAIKHKNQMDTELTLKRIDGSEFPVQLNCQNVNSMLRVSVTDISKIKQAEAALRQTELMALADAEHKRREQQEQEHLHKLAHVSRLGLMGEMASGIAHEVNQPLSAISSYTQVGLNLINAEQPDLAKIAEILSKTQQQSLKAGQIIHNMKRLVKFPIKNKSSVDLNALIHNAVGLCMADLKQHSINLELGLEATLPPVYVNCLQIEQAIINLIRNSVETLQNLPKENPKDRLITLKSHLTPRQDIRVSVEDNGMGLDESQQQKIFTPFYTTKAEGMGMGLAISRSLVEAHGGNLHFRSQFGKGSTFYFILPVQ